MNHEVMVKRLSDANPVPNPDLLFPEDRVQADRILRQVLSSPTAEATWRTTRSVTFGTLASSAIAATIAVVVVAVALSVAGHKRRLVQTTGPATHSALAKLDQSFAALRRVRTSADTLPRDGVLVLTTLLERKRAFGLLPDQSRRLAAVPTETIWLVPGQREACTLVLFGSGPRWHGAAAGCARPADLAKQGIIEIGGNAGLIAVLPDGSSSLSVTLKDGSSFQLSPNRDGAIARSVDKPVRSVSFIGPDGEPHVNKAR